ncbi:DgyrCDS354 [Dimorphilus gyrociliatus]|uniref:DgyrCDS354 n=1 Tax=Dimorphilus gyrociliatus TaxID=2664684 RepID=A0A7I8V4F0_9ANNE|nr:DgyrCDS354 [Dimorphilus gyrociliatus]
MFIISLNNYVKSKHVQFEKKYENYMNTFKPYSLETGLLHFAVCDFFLSQGMIYNHLAYAPWTPITEKIMKKLAERFGQLDCASRKARSGLAGNETCGEYLHLLPFTGEFQLERYFNESGRQSIPCSQKRNSILAAVIFPEAENYKGTLPEKIKYDLRMHSDPLGVEGFDQWMTRTKILNRDGPYFTFPQPYIYEPPRVDKPKQFFLELQWLIDSTIIELQAPRANLSRFTYQLIVRFPEFLKPDNRNYGQFLDSTLILSVTIVIGLFLIGETLTQMRRSKQGKYCGLILHGALHKEIYIVRIASTSVFLSFPSLIFLLSMIGSGLPPITTQVCFYITTFVEYFIEENYFYMLIPRLLITHINFGKTLRKALHDKDDEIFQEMSHMIANLLIYLFLLFFTAHIAPAPHGLGLSWNFLFSSKYWMCRFEREHCQSDDYYREYSLAVQLDNIQKIVQKGVLRTETVAPFSMKIPTDEITVILGPPKSGKSALAEMISSNTLPTSGDITVCGINTKDQRSKSLISLSKDYDLIYSNLTIAENIEFYHSLKGIQAISNWSNYDKMPRLLTKKGKLGIDYVLQQFEMLENSKASCYTSDDRIILNFCIALTGQSEIIVIDHLLSKMIDFRKRQRLWDTIKELKVGRAIILTSTNMSEVRILDCRTICLIANGVVQFVGSQRSFAKTYGIGYELSFNFTTELDIDYLNTMVSSSIRKLSIIKKEKNTISYRLPFNSSNKFAELFSKVYREDRNFNLRLISYDDVYDKIYKGELRITSDNKDDYHIETFTAMMMYGKSKLKNIKYYTNSKTTEMKQKLLALVEYRLSVYIRLWPILLLLALSPVFGVIVWTQGDNPTEFLNWPPIELSAGTYASKDCEVPYFASPSLRKLSKIIGNHLKYYNIPLKNVSAHLKNKTAREFEQKLQQLRIKHQGYFNQRYFLAYLFLPGEKVTLAAFYSSSALHSPAVAVNTISNTLLKNFAGEQFSIIARNYPLPPRIKAITTFNKATGQSKLLWSHLRARILTYSLIIFLGRDYLREQLGGSKFMCMNSVALLAPQVILAKSNQIFHINYYHKLQCNERLIRREQCKNEPLRIRQTLACCQECRGSHCVRYADNILSFAKPGLGRFCIIFMIQTFIAMMLLILLQSHRPVLQTILEKRMKLSRLKSEDLSLHASAIKERKSIILCPKFEQTDYDVVAQNITKYDIQSLSKINREIKLENVYLSIKRGELMCLTGLKNSGKTTFLRIIAGSIKPSKGVVYFRKNMQKSYFDNNIIPDGELTVAETLNFVARLRGISKKAAKSHVRNISNLCALKPMMNMKVDTVSESTKKRLVLASTIIGFPQLLVIRDPSTNIDFQSKKIFMNLLGMLKARGHTIVLSTENPVEFENLADRMAVFCVGVLRAVGPAPYLRQCFCPGSRIRISMTFDSTRQMKIDRQSISRWLQIHVPDSVRYHVDLLQARLYFSVPPNVSIGQLFASMENMKEVYTCIREYDIGEHTFESVIFSVSYIRSLNSMENLMKK